MVAAGLYSGQIHGVLMDPATNKWSVSWQIAREDSADIDRGVGTKALSGALTQWELSTTGGTQTFDLLGGINCIAAK